MDIKKWDLRFLELARFISNWSKDTSTKVGAVITDKKNIISVGYNGFPVGVSDDDRLLDRPTKYSIIVHAEMNAIIRANRDIKGCTLYTYPFMPCSRCAGIIISKGISRVVSFYTDNPRWVDNFQLSLDLFKEASIETVLYEEKA